VPEISEYEPKDNGIPIIHPDELTRKFEDHAFSDSVAAVTTTSIDSIRSLLSDPHRNFPLYNEGYINLDLVDDVYEDLIGGSLHDKISVSKTISQNNEAYGQTQAAIGLLLERGASHEVIKDLTYMHDFGWFTQKALRDFSDDEIDSKFANYKEITNYIREIWTRDEGYVKGVETALKEVFPKAKKVANFLKDLRDRNGVQLVLGDRKNFISFARSKNHEPVDDAGITLYADIPRSLILGIVPRGKFEQQELLRV
jgi:hypothetical protein